ncbi:trypsin-like peptidase domain-containing protein [Mucilaginibacter psychrotolerans]|uniref:Serine protease n=1 Tax=Mucilaginibacter psychrotolerans TaxID=1524096 RepID=A0A4Y8S2T3_9SPHI|nr:trypsin-like peptidase domain-containing protein [Mucilaginibacter psychrotolerans]TFF33338.1 serine protease [Mucilaginibacter psychrotolerans]
MWKQKFLIAIIIQLCAIATVSAQPKPGTAVQLQAGVSGAIAKGYPASVLMWEVDAVSHTRQSAQFSGVVISKEGQILSAAHVVMPGKSYQVMFPDGRQCFAKGLGRIAIPPTFMQPDAAMLQITDKGLWPFAEMGWSSSLNVNQPCISIAYPESLEQRKPTVRYGRISELRNKYGFLQSTCVMEPGDSGGPLFDLLGRVIGIHSGIEVSENVNYEIPIDTYRKYFSALGDAKNFASLPADTNIVGKDSLSTGIQQVSIATEMLKTQKQLAASFVRISSIVDGQKQEILGTLFSSDTFSPNHAVARQLLISKSSMVGDTPMITSGNGKTFKGIVLKRNRANDLVVIAITKKIRQGVTLTYNSEDIIAFQDLGKQLISPRPDSSSLTGILGSMLINLPKKTSYGYIGATTGFKGNKLVFTFIQPGKAAAIGGLLTDDIVDAVDGHLVADELDFVRAIGKYSAGDTTTVTVTRGGQKLEIRIVLHYPPLRTGNHPAERFAGGKSIKRDGFEQVVVQDARIKPNECGGPVFDTDGSLIGINIARLSRTSTVIIPVSNIKKILSRLLR